MKFEEELGYDINYHEAEGKYFAFKRSDATVSPRQMELLEAAYASLKLMQLHEDNISNFDFVELIDFTKMKPLLKSFEKQFQPVFQIEILHCFFEFFRQQKFFALQKFFILFMIKIHSKAVAERAEQDPKMQLNRNLTVDEELIFLELIINKCKIAFMRSVLDNSANYQIFGNELEISNELDTQKAAFLNDLLEGVVDKEFRKIPLICKTYEESENFAKTLSKTCSDGLEIYKKNPEFMKRIREKCRRVPNYEKLKLCLNGYVYRQTAKFVSNLNRRMKFLDKGIEYLGKLVQDKPTSVKHSFDENYS
jgi:hypothetical protein